MTAAGGILHEEFHSPAFARSRGLCRMVQLSVNTKYQSILDADIPPVDLPQGAGRVSVIAGDLGGVRGPARTFTPINVWDLRLSADKSVSLDLREGHTALSGEPIDEPVVGHGPFVMTSQEEIRAAIDDFNVGRVGQMAHA